MSWIFVLFLVEFFYVGVFYLLVIMVEFLMLFLIWVERFKSIVFIVIGFIFVGIVIGFVLFCLEVVKWS